MTEVESYKLLLEALNNLEKNEYFLVFLKEYIIPKREKLIRDLTRVSDLSELSKKIGKLEILNKLVNLQELKDEISGLLELKIKGRQI